MTKGITIQRGQIPPDNCPVLPWAAGRWYAAGPYSQDPTTFSFIANAAIVPLLVPTSRAWSQVVFEVTTAGAAGNTIRVGLYEDDFGAPGRLVADFGKGASDAIAVVPLATSQYVSAGSYWIIAISTALTPVLRGLTGAPVNQLGRASTTPLIQGGWGMTVTGNFATEGMPRIFVNMMEASAVSLTTIPRILIGV